MELLFFLFSVAILAGFLDTLAGGGGLIVLPALIMSGIPPLAALGTNKLQGTIGTATATLLMLRGRRIRWRNIKQLMLAAFIGAAVGSVLVQFIDTAVLSFIIPVVLFAIAMYFILAPTPLETKQKPKYSIKTYRNLVVPTIGCYDGMFGPGTGSFFALAGISFRGHTILSSTAEAKALNFSTNIASLAIFATLGQLVWSVGLVMMLGQFIGSWLGSHYLFRINPRHLRFLIVFMCLAMLVKYIESM